MCTRYTLHQRKAAVDTVAKALGRAFREQGELAPDYNVAPTREVPVVALESGGQASLRGMLWGLLPFYERRAATAKLLPNARSETAASSPAFREAVACRRCLVPANGFYEWKSVQGRKVPMLFSLRGGESFAFAGIWQPGGSDGLDTFAILTTAPNTLVSPIHDRMPVILRAELMARWLGAAPLGSEAYAVLTRALVPDLMEVCELSEFLNSTRNNGPQCHEKPKIGGAAQLDLF